MINESFVWVPLPGLNRGEVLDVVTKDALEFHEVKGTSVVPDHVWVTNMNNKGTMLFCYVMGLFPFEQNGKKGNCWYAKRIPECNELDVYDCPIRLLEAAVPLGEQWRTKTMRYHEELKNK